MSDLAQELATLVADTLAAAESWRATGAGVVAVGRLDGLPPAEPWPAAPARPATPAGARPGPPSGPAALDRAPARPAEPPRRFEPPPAPERPAAPAARVAPPERVAAPPERAPARPEPSQAFVPPAAAPAAPASPPGAGLAGLFGSKWQVALRDRAAEIDSLLAGIGACPDCGTPAVDLRGNGKADASLVVLATGPGARPLGPEGGAMLERMLLNVLSVERGDIWLLEANRCAAGGGSCKSAIRRQVDTVSPRLVLLMGAGGGAVLGGVPPVKGEWSPWGSADVIATFHPAELLERPGDKRATMDHLTTLRRRM